MRFSNWALYIVNAKAKYPIGSRIHEAIPSLISSDDDHPTNISKLEKVPESIILSLDPIRRKVTQSFLHQSTNFAFLGDTANLVGVSGYDPDKATPLQFDPATFFSFTDKVHTPSLLCM